MKAGAVTVLGGLSVIGAVAALYFWPSSIGARCPALTMTADEIVASQDLRKVTEAYEASVGRSTCLTDELQALLANKLSPPFDGFESVVRMPFIVDDLKRWRALAQTSDAARSAAIDRLYVLESAAAAPQQN